MMFRSFAMAVIAALCSLGSPARAEVTSFPALSGNRLNVLRIASVTDLASFRPIIEAFRVRFPEVAVEYEESTSENLDTVTADACRDERNFADLVVSSSLPRQIWFVNEGCAEPLTGIVSETTPAWADWRHEIVGLTYEPSVIVYNKAAVPPGKVPRNRFDLIELLRESDVYSGKVGTYDIERSQVGYFLAFEDSEQASTWGRILESLGRNHVQLFCCTSDILDRVADGRLSFGYNMIGAYALERERNDERLGVILPSDYTLVLTRAALVPKTAHNKVAAKQFLAFVLSAEGQRILVEDLGFSSPLVGAESLKGRLSGNIDALRPIALTPTLLVPLDQQKRQMFIDQWRQSLALGRQN